MIDNYDAASFWVTLIGTVATVLALGVAVVTIYHQISALRRESNERGQAVALAELDRQRSQAERVSGVLLVDEARANVLQITRSRDEGQRAATLAKLYPSKVEVHNASDLPIYDVGLPLLGIPGMVVVGKNRLPVIRGGQSLTLLGPNQDNRAQHGRPVQFEFRDAAGRYWVRHPGGALKLVKEPPKSEDPST